MPRTYTKLEVQRRRLLSKEEESSLAMRAQAGDDQARKRMIEANLGLVISIARQQRRPGLELRDLTHEGVVGLIHAIEKFDPEREVRFATYASWWIRQAIQQAILSSGRTIRLPASAVDKLRSIARAEQRLTASLGRAPRMSELAAETGLTPENIVELRFASEQPAPLDAVVAGDRATLKEQVAARVEQDPEKAVDLDQMRLTLGVALAGLPDLRQRQILELHYGLGNQPPRTFNEIGQTLHLTAARVCQLERSALASLRSLPIAESWHETVVS
jgi:RNA polymerase primary sigma factor